MWGRDRIHVITHQYRSYFAFPGLPRKLKCKKTEEENKIHLYIYINPQLGNVASFKTEKSGEE